MDNDKIFYLRSRKNDAQISPIQYRTYIEPFIGMWIVFLMGLMFVEVVLMKSIFNYPLIDIFKTYFTKFHQIKEQGLLSQYQNAINIFVLPVVGLSAWISWKLNKVVNYVKIVENGSKYYLGNKEAVDEYKRFQEKDFDKAKNGIVLANKIEDKYELILDPRTEELSIFITGEAGSGKTVLIKQVISNWVVKKHKCILHDPKLEFIEGLVEANVSSALIAPWLSNSHVIDYAKLIYTDNELLRTSLIELFIYSFAGFPNPKGGNDEFWKEGARIVLIALTKELVNEKKDSWTLIDWIVLTESKSNLNDIVDIIRKNSPEASFLIDKEKGGNTAQGILTTTVSTIKNIKNLASMWEGNKKMFDIKQWLYDKKPKYQFICLANSSQYPDIASGVIASFVNIAIALLLAPEYKMALMNNLHITLDEFNSFAKYVDINRFKGLMDLGRSAKIRIEIAQQRQTQANEYLTDQKQADDFLGSFQNRIYCRPSSSDYELIKSQIGTHKEEWTKITGSNNAQGQSSSTVVEVKDVSFEPNILSTRLGPDKKSGGVWVALNTVQNPVVAKVLIKYKSFLKQRIDERKAKGTYINQKFVAREKRFIELKDGLLVNADLSNENNYVVDNGTKTVVSNEIEDVIDKKKSDISIYDDLEKSFSFDEKREDEVINDIAKDNVLETVDHSGTLSLINSSVEIAEALQDKNNNSSVVVEIESSEELKNKKRRFMQREK